MKRLSNAFSFIFSDNEWFNKVLVGGFYLLLIPFGIGIVMLNGFLAEFMSNEKNGEKAMPYWRKFNVLFNIGLRHSWLSLSLIAGAYIAVIAANIELSVPSAIVFLAVFLTVNTMLVVKTFDLLSVAVSFVLVLTAISVGWMWIVVGWPLLIFLALLLQSHLLASKR